MKTFITLFRGKMWLLLMVLMISCYSTRQENSNLDLTSQSSQFLIESSRTPKVDDNLHLPIATLSVTRTVPNSLSDKLQEMVTSINISRDLDLEDRSNFFWSDSNCTVPCWNGLLPGSSTVRDFKQMTTLFSSGNFNNLTIYYSSIGWENDRYNITSDIWVTEEGILEQFDFIRLAKDNDFLTLGEIEQNLGKPDEYSIGLYTYPIEGFPYSLNTVFVYKDRGLITSTNQQVPKSAYLPTCKIFIDEEYPIDRISFVAPNLFEKDRWYSSDWRNLGGRAIKEVPQEWLGYGMVDVMDCREESK